MKLLIPVLSLALLSCASSNSALHEKHLFFLHNRFTELFGVDGSHPRYGKVEYAQIVEAFRTGGFQVWSEVRPDTTNVEHYARKIAAQIDSVIQSGVRPADITVVGTSKGGYIAMYVSTYLKNKDINYVFVGCCTEEELAQMPVQFYGRVLNIYDRSDPFGESCKNLATKYKNTLATYEELELTTGINHAFLYKALPDWIEPSIAWARQQPVLRPSMTRLLDSILATPHSTPFNGNVLVTQNGRTLYAKCQGFSHIEQQTPLVLTDQFVLGSVSKHITATLVLREYEKGTLHLHAPIGRYLSGLKQPWKDSVSLHHLLSHTHGIADLDKPLAFTPGTQFAYGNIGFNLAGTIVEKTTGKSFAALSREVFQSLGLSHLTHPEYDADSNLVTGYTSIAGTYTPAPNTMQASVAAGGFVASTVDLAAWTTALHHGKLLRDSTYRLMTTKKPNAIRPHLAFDTMEYGYGLCLDTDLIGHTGFAPGFVSVVFYYPKSQLTIVVLENVADENIAKAYDYHKHLVNALRTFPKE